MFLSGKSATLAELEALKAKNTELQKDLAALKLVEQVSKTLVEEVSITLVEEVSITLVEEVSRTLVELGITLVEEVSTEQNTC